MDNALDISVPEAEMVKAEKPKIKFELNADEMKFRELIAFEKVTGRSFANAVKEVIVKDENDRPVPDPDPAAKGRPLTRIDMDMLTVAGMIYVIRMREDKAVTWDDVLDMDMSQIDFEVIKADELPVDPTPAETEATAATEPAPIESVSTESI